MTVPPARPALAAPPPVAVGALACADGPAASAGPAVPAMASTAPAAASRLLIPVRVFSGNLRSTLSA